MPKEISTSILIRIIIYIMVATMLSIECSGGNYHSWGTVVEILFKVHVEKLYTIYPIPGQKHCHRHHHHHYTSNSPVSVLCSILVLHDK